MEILISVNGVRKSFGARPLFEGLNFVIESGDRVGLIGPNGAGKSTLLRILSGMTTPDSGDLSKKKGLKVGFLEQTPRLPPGVTVEEAVRGGVPDLHDEQASGLAGELLSRLELNSRAGALVDRLSGGWKKRVALARELAQAPDVLLLDEPTNHLDIESILWLETFLARAEFACVVVTHDRLFLQRVTNRILELDKRNPDGLLNVRGDYSTYLERKTELLETQNRLEQVLNNTLRREMEWLRRGAKARTTKQQARIQATEALQDEVAELEYRNQSRTARIDFQSSEKKPKRLVEAMQITKAYGERVLFRNLDLFIGPGSRLGLLGTNGCGKSTLIRVLLGSEKPDAGSVLRSENLKVAYFEQNRDTLDPDATLRKTLCPHGDHVNYRGKLAHINGYLDRFLFRKEQFDMVVGKLSGGEQSRVLLARLMLKEANLLVLDEPTNDLDVETLDVLQNCLMEFDGAVLLVTHDRFFLDQVATQIYAFSTSLPGEIVAFAGLDQWENWRKAQAQEKKAAAKAEQNQSSEKKRKLSFNETRELSQMEQKIQETEQRLSGFQEAAQAPSNQSNAAKLAELYQSITQVQAELDGLYARWAELEALKN